MLTGRAFHLRPSVISPPTGPTLHKVTLSQVKVSVSQGQLKPDHLTAHPNEAKYLGAAQGQTCWFCEHVCIGEVGTTQESKHKHTC